MDKIATIRNIMQINYQLLSLKIALFLYNGANNMYNPYLVLQGYQVGITKEETSIISALLPIISFIGSPLAGYVFDKLGSARKWLLFGCICVGALLNNALLFVDARQPNITQQASTFSFRCAGELENQGWSFSFPTQKTFHNLTDYINGGIIIKCRTPPDSPPSSKLSVETHSSHHVSIIQDGDSKLDDDGWLCKANVWNITCLADTLADVLAAEVKEYGQAGRQQGFWIYVALMLGSRICVSAMFSLLDSTSIHLAESHNGSLGLQRLWSLIGQIMFSLVAGGLVTWMTNIKGTGERQYDLVFYGSTFLYVCLAITVVSMDIGKSEPRSKTVDSVASPPANKLRSLLFTPEVIVVLLIAVLNGIFTYYIDTYFFVFLAELQASDFLLSMSSVVTNVASIPLLLFGDKMLVDKFGYAPVISLIFLAYTVRMVGYSLLSNPWWCIPFEILKAFTTQMFASAAGSFCRLYEKSHGLIATLNGLLIACNISLGKGLGSYLGGDLPLRIGRPTAFQVTGSISAVIGIVYFFMDRCFLRKKRPDQNQNTP